MLPQFRVLLIQLERLPEARSALDRLWNVLLFTIGQTPVTVMTVLTVAVILLVTIVVARTAQSGAQRAFAGRGVTNTGTITAVTPSSAIPAVLFEVSVWISDAWRARIMRSELHEAIWWALKGVGVTIPFLQRDVHLIPRA